MTTPQVAEALAVTTASASNMLKKLDGLGYVVQVKRQGVELTDAGRQAALEVIRHHRLLETYLATRLGMPWDEVHREAEVLEHHVSEALADRIAEALGHPERDPHGHPIPTSAGQMPSMPSRRLSEMDEGAEAVVGRVDDRDDALLRFLAERGLVPEARVEVLGHSPFGGPISVRVGEPGRRRPPRSGPRGARGVRRWCETLITRTDRTKETSVTRRKPLLAADLRGARRARRSASPPAATTTTRRRRDDDRGDARRHHGAGDADAHRDHARQRPPAARPPSRSTPTRAAPLAFIQKTLTAKPGEVTITFTNDAPVPHNIAVGRDRRRGQRHGPATAAPPS